VEEVHGVVGKRIKKRETRLSLSFFIKPTHWPLVAVFVLVHIFRVRFQPYYYDVMAVALADPDMNSCTGRCVDPFFGLGCLIEKTVPYQLNPILLE
jgi:hypothetical protein